MRRTTMITALAASAIVLSGCGGSSSGGGDTVTIVTAAGTTSAATSSATPATTTTATHASASATGTAPVSAPATSAASTAGASPSTRHGAGSRARTSRASTPSVTPHAATPTTNASLNPVPCLQASQLVDAGLSRPNEWQARFPITHAVIYVDGPYRTVAMARASAASLNGVEFAAAGGLFEVSAVLSSHLGASVNAVAACLARTTSTASPSGNALTY